MEFDTEDQFFFFSFFLSLENLKCINLSALPRVDSLYVSSLFQTVIKLRISNEEAAFQLHQGVEFDHKFCEKKKLHFKLAPDLSVNWSSSVVAKLKKQH